MIGAFFVRMALIYKNQGMIERLSVKTGVATYRKSEQRQILFGGRGSKYDELVYLRGQNTSAQTVDQYDSDSWQKFATANGAAGTRTDTIQHDFCVNGSFP